MNYNTFNQIANRIAARYHGQDPYWIIAKYPGVSQKGKPIKKGDKVLYFPNTKAILSGPEAEDAWRKFEAQKQDEDMYRMAGLRDGSSLLPEVNQAIHEIITDVLRDKTSALRALRGRDGGLRPSKPKDSLYAYIWRMARFHSGDDPKMPVMAYYDLADGIQQRLQMKGFNKVHTPEYFQKQLQTWGPNLAKKTDTLGSLDIDKKEEARLDPFIDELLVELGRNPFGGAARWKGLI